jgi:pimeloyl-ACP methyl ester carboxylesterase
MTQARWSRIIASLVLSALVLAPSGRVLGDDVILKNGVVYQGSVDRDKPILWVFDGLKRVVLYDSKVAKVVSNTPFGNWEWFKLVQPMITHAGTMPKEAVVVADKVTPWNDRARRMFAYFTAKSTRIVTMEQAIYELGPYFVRIRGVDGFWQDGRLATSQIPREVVLGLLAKVERGNQNERLRIARFLIQAQWYTEARAELDAIAREFSDLREVVANARASVVQLEATQHKAEIDIRRKAQQFRDVRNRLKAFPSKDVSADLLVEIRDQLRHDDAQAAADQSMADDLKSLGERLAESKRAKWKRPLLEVLRALTEAPDAVRDRFVAWQKARADTGTTDEARFALAMSGYVVGPDAAVPDLASAAVYWKLRDLVHSYLSSHDAAARSESLLQLEALELPEEPAQPVTVKKLDLLTRIVQRMPPPLHDGDESAGEMKLRRVQDDDNAEPTEYAVLLPPEYHPLRSYPAVVALHGGHGPESAIDWWKAEAQRRGYIVIAPEYNLPGQPKDYRYTTSEHAAVELALRDARKRYAIDGDRVFLGGQLLGGNMAWDFGLAHPDLFAGVSVVSGMPFKYVYKYLPHTDRLPLYVALGDLAPASSEVVFLQVLKPLILKANDATYVEYFHRALEDIPEEAPHVFDWMDRRRREPVPKSFDALSARESDERFYGVVIREFLPGRTTDPEAADPFGKNLNPATIKMESSSLSNQIRVRTAGVKRLDVWVSPRLIDFKKKLEVRVNNKSYFKGPAKPNVEPMLEDLRLRGDRQQIYWLKVPAG